MSILGNRDINVTNSAITAIPGALATVILFDSTVDPGTGATATSLSIRRMMPDIKRVCLRLFADQTVTVFLDGVGKNSSTWRTVNGAGAGESATLSTLFERDWNVGNEDDFRVRITTPAGAIATWDVSVKLRTDQALAQ